MTDSMSDWPGKCLDLDTETKTQGEEIFPNQQFRFCVFSLDGHHAPASFFLRHNICHFYITIYGDNRTHEPCVPTCIEESKDALAVRPYQRIPTANGIMTCILVRWNRKYRGLLWWGAHREDDRKLLSRHL